MALIKESRPKTMTCLTRGKKQFPAFRVAQRAFCYSWATQSNVSVSRIVDDDAVVYIWRERWWMGEEEAQHPGEGEGWLSASTDWTTCSR